MAAKKKNPKVPQTKAWLTAQLVESVKLLGEYHRRCQRLEMQLDEADKEFRHFQEKYRQSTDAHPELLDKLIATKHELTAANITIKQLTRTNETQEAELQILRNRKAREYLPDTRESVIHKFDIAGVEGYLCVGLYPDGRPGEIFVEIQKSGGTISGLVDSIAIAVSIGLQYGVPIGIYVRKYAHQRFEPSGITPNPDIPMATSIVDYLFRWIGLRFVPEYAATQKVLQIAEKQPG